MQRLLLITGQRLSEIAGMRWAELDFDARLWRIPRDRMKADRAHVVPLSELALQILQGLPRCAGSPFVFPAQRERKKTPDLAGIRSARHVSGFSKAKDECDRLIAAAGHQVPAWRWHDLRRTVRTNLSRLRIPDVVAELAIGHIPQGLAAVYNQWTFIEEKREALEARSGLLRRILTPEAQADNVVSLNRSR